MSLEAAAAADTSTTTSAPAASAPASAAVAPVSEPAPQAPATTQGNGPSPPLPGAPNQAEPAPEEAEAEPDGFDLDAWDGDVASLPPEFEKFSKAFESKLEAKYKAEAEKWTAKASEIEKREAKLAELEQRSLLLDALLDGNEDPRIAQTKAMLEERDAKIAEFEGRATQAEKELAAYREQVEKAEYEKVRATWMEWKEAHPALVKTDADIDAVAKLLDSGWDLDLIPKLASLPKAMAKQARDLVAKGEASPRVALQLFSDRPSAPERPASALVAGAHGPSGTPAEMKEGKYAVSYQDMKENAIQRALRKNA